MASSKHSPVFIDMTPMVDIAFLLIILFMAKTQYKAPESIPIVLPESHSVIKLPESDVVILTVGPRPGNELFWRLEPQPEVKIEMSEMEKALVEARIRNPRFRIAIKAHKEAEFGIISDMMEILQKTNNTRFNLVTNFEDDSGGSSDEDPTSLRPVNNNLVRR